MKKKLVVSLLVLACAFAGAACEGADKPFDGNGGSDGDADGDSDSDADADADSDADSDADGDTDVPTETGPIEPDCSGCVGVGSTLEAMLCAIDMCDPETVIGQDYFSPSNSNVQGSYAAVAHYGSQSNDLAPLLNNNYALMASGLAEGTNKSTNMGGNSIADPFSSDGYQINDVFRWELNLKAPPGAHGFQIHYVFFSAEYDEYVNSVFNDKFYILLEAQSTNGGQQTVINYTDCREPNSYYDFTGSDCDTPSGYCCFIAVNTALSECCWYPHGSWYAPNSSDPPCPQGTWTTDISGTGFSCASSVSQDSAAFGSSTGWLKTEWPVNPGEEFTVTFQIHDASDSILDSQVILDKFLFVGTVEQGTVPID